MKKRLSILLGIIACFPFTAASFSIDDLRKRANEATDSTKVEALEQLAMAYKNVDSDSALAVLQRQLVYAREIGHAQGTARALLNMGLLYHFKGNDEQALLFLFKAKEIFEQNNDFSGLGATYVQIGVIPESQGRHDRAMNYYFKALKAYEETEDEEGVAHVFNNMGNLHKKLENLPEALKNYEKSIKVYRTLGNRERVAGVLTNMATVYNAMGDLDKALEYDFEALRTYERSNNLRGIGSVANNIGVIYYMKELYKDALTYFTLALENGRKVDQKDLIALALCNIGEVNIFLGDYINAMKYFDEGIELNRQLNNHSQLVDAYRGLTLLYEHIGNPTKALETYKKATEMKERLLDDERLRVMAEMQANYENEQKQKEIEYQTFVIDKQRAENNLLTLVMIISAALLGVVIYGYFRIRASSKEMEKLSIVASKTHNGVMIYDKVGKVEYINDGFVSLSGYTVDEILSQKGKTVQEISSNPDIDAVLERVRTSKIPVSYLAPNQTKDGRKLWISTTLSPVFNEKGEVQKIVAIDTDFTENKRKSDEIEKSIAYAKKIQEAILPMRQQITRAFPNSFILYNPKAIVSGDFYWFAERNGHKYIAVADCTGHGVPGAFMSVLGSNALNQIIRREGKEGPAEILNTLHRAIRRSLKQDLEGSESREGMDIALCRIDLEQRKISYAGAQRPLYLVRNGELNEVAPDKFPIGGYQSEKERLFTRHDLEFMEGDMLYLSSDGYPDQFGGPRGKKFMNKRFRALITSFSHETPDMQKKMLEDQFRGWKGSEEQVDDVLVIGIRL